MHDSSVFGRWLQRRRRSLDLTQRELAARVGCSVATIRKLEADERRPSKRTALAMAQALEVDVGDTDAFVRFARQGWVDAAPPAATAPDLPWRPQRERETLPTPPAAAPGRPRPTSGRRETGGIASTEEAFVARERELSELGQALDEACRDGIRAVLVAGEAGQGKSALLRAFAARAVQRVPELVVVTGSCNAYVGVGDPFLPFREVLAQLLGGPPVPGRGGVLAATRASRAHRVAPLAREAIRAQGPHLVGTLVPEPLLEADPAAAEHPNARAPAAFAVPEEALRSEVAAVLGAVARQVPLLVVLDDLHWVDRSSAELLLHLVRTQPDAAMLVLGAHRPSEIASPDGAGRHAFDVVLRELERTQGRVQVDLAQADARAFLDAYLDAEPNAFDLAFREALWRQTGGQPLLTVELVRDLVERGDLVRAVDGRWTVAHAIAWDRVPDRVAGALAQRLARVNARALELLRLASVAGVSFTPEVLARALRREPGEVVRTLGELSGRHRLLTEGELQRAGERHVEVYRFRHDLIQRFVADQLGPGVRRHLHGVVADALVAVAGEDADPGLLAHHLRSGDAPERAAPYLRRAGDRARRAGGLDEAIVHYRDALGLARQPDDGWRAEVLCSLAECLWLRGALEPARRAALEGQRLYLALGDTPGAGHAELIAARTRFEQGSSADALAALHRARETLERGPESAMLARAVSSISQLHMVSSDTEEAVSWGERALAIAARVGAEDVTIHAWNNVGTALATGVPERRTEGLELLRRSYRGALRLGLVYDACRAAFNLAELLGNFGDHEAARATHSELVDLAVRHELFAMESAGRRGLWDLDWRTGQWTTAFERRAVLEGLIARAEPGSLKNVTLLLTFVLADLDLGSIDGAWRLLSPVAPKLETLEEPQTRAPYLRARLRHAVGAGDVGAADARARALVALAAAGVPLFDSVAAGLREVVRWWSRPRWGLGAPGLEPADVERRDRAIDMLARAGAHLGPAEAAASASEGRAAWAWATGDPRAAADALEGAAEAWRDGAMPLHEARAWEDAASAASAAGETDRAARAAARADALFAMLAAQIPDPALAASFRRSHALNAGSPPTTPTR